MQVANQYLTRGPCPTLPGWPETGDWIAQRPRVAPNTTANNKQTTNKQTNKMIPKDPLLY